MWVKLGRAYSSNGTVSRAGDIRVRVAPVGEKSSHIRLAIGFDIAKKIGLANKSPILVSAKVDRNGKHTGRYRISACKAEERTCKVHQIGRHSNQLTALVSVPMRVNIPVMTAKWSLGTNGLYISIPIAGKPEATNGATPVKRVISPEGLAAMRRNAAASREKKRMLQKLREAEAGR